MMTLPKKRTTAGTIVFWIVGEIAYWLFILLSGLLSGCGGE